MNTWLPWRLLLRRTARRRGFVDPFAFLARLRQFSQPSEVQEPIELIRAGVVFHARGLVNTKVLQNNLDWVWPYWVSRQFDPADPSFLPRAFSFSHVNLTHRNWTALGLPGSRHYPIVDPRGLITPLLDGWSLDWWWLPEDGDPVYPSRRDSGEQRMEMGEELRVVTEIPFADGNALISVATVARRTGATEPVLELTASLRQPAAGRLVLAVRPANPEGVSFIDHLTAEGSTLCVNDDAPVRLDPAPDHWSTSQYKLGDVSRRLETRAEQPTRRCDAGLVTAAAVYELSPEKPQTITAIVTLPAVGPAVDTTAASLPAAAHPPTWPEALAPTPKLEIPDARWRFLHQAALHTVALLSPDEIFPGPSTYRRFWFRDACLIMNALLAVNLTDRVRHALGSFPARQRRDGYFHSQEGEWDANGQVLWIADRVERCTGHLLPAELYQSLQRGAHWIERKRGTTSGERHTGLLPSGFSAEHLGPNDYYYWDDFWGVAGLDAAAAMSRRRGDEAQHATWENAAGAFAHAIERSLDSIPAETGRQGIPASPYRRMDAGAIGSMVADYPLRSPRFDSKTLLRTADWLHTHCLHHGAFFQDMIHSGTNAYLTLALAQTFLRAGDPRYDDLVRAVAEAASPTGHWPEAIHPHTGGGCMGDGQHAWAAAEWLLMIRALFVREEDDHLVIGSGLRTSWLETGRRLSYGPTATPWGAVKVMLRLVNSHWQIQITGDWHGAAPRLRVIVPGYKPIEDIQPGWELELESLSGH